MRFFRPLLLVAFCFVVFYPLGARQLARTRLAARLARLERAPARLACGPDGAEALSLRVERLGPLLASWETIGGCGAGGGTNGAGIKWIGRSTTGGLFNVQSLANFITIPVTSAAGSGAGGYNFIVNTQITRDIDDKWTAGVAIPYLYKWYRHPYPGFGAVANAGLGDINLLGTRRLGQINATSLTGILTIPTGTYKAEFTPPGVTMGSTLTADEQLGFGRFTGSLLLDHTIDQDWGLIVVGGAANYRGGTNDVPNYRAPGATTYGYAGYFLGPLVPTLGVNFAGFTRQDTTGAFGDNLNTPVLTAAAQASIEWSNPYVAVLLGTYIPWGILGANWHTSDKLALQAWTVALGVSVSPF